jgi:broad specificity phosphatase PhoE
MQPILPTNLIITYVNSGLTTTGDIDLHSQLSDKGQAKAKLLGALLSQERFDLALTSVAMGARQTTAHILPSHSLVPQVDCEELYFPPARDDEFSFVSMRDRLGNATLDAYRKHPDAAVLTRYAEAFATRRDEVMAKAFGGPHTRSLLVVGHRVLINAIVAHDCERSGYHSGVARMLFTILGDCEGFRLTLNDHKVFRLEYLPLTQGR